MSTIAHLQVQLPSANDEDFPTIILTQRVLEKIFAASMQHVQHETGEAMVGVALPNGKQKLPKLYIMDTISPVGDAIRQWGMFEQGDDWQGAIFNWWHENWEMYREWRRGSYGNAIAAKWDAPLLHLGDWHKQPDGMIRPSGGDMRTAKRLMKEEDLPYLLMPIVTFDTETGPLEEANALAIATRDQRLRIDFWWVARRGNTFDPVHPILEPDGTIPRLPPVVWWLADSARFDIELAALELEGLEVMDIISWSENGRPPLDTCFIIYRPGHSDVIIACTPFDYPAKPARWRKAPIVRPGEDDDFFQAIYRESEKIAPAKLVGWRPDMLMVDIVRMIEEQA